MTIDVTFATFVTPAGVVIAAAVITTLVQLLKQTVPVIDAKISGALLAFGFSAVLYIVTAWALSTTGDLEGPNGLLGVFMAWLSAATSAVGIKSSTTHVMGNNNPVNDSVEEDIG